jgi:hypothetical protein
MTNTIMIPSFAQPGDTMRYKNHRGLYLYQTKEAEKVFNADDEYIVNEARIGRSSSEYSFEGISGFWNTCMFEFAYIDAILAETPEEREARRVVYQKSQTYMYEIPIFGVEPKRIELSMRPLINPFSV